MKKRRILFDIQKLKYVLKLWSTYVKLSKQFISIFIRFTFIRGILLMYSKTAGIHAAAI